MKLRALGKQVIIAKEKFSGEKQTKGGILLADNTKESYVFLGSIVDVGPDVKQKKLLTTGTKVLYTQYVDTEILKHRLDKDLIAVKEEDLVCIVDEEEVTDRVD